MTSYHAVEIPAKRLSEDIAREMAKVGAVMMRDTVPIGHVFDLAGQPAVVTAELTYEEFMERPKAALGPARFKSVGKQDGFRFYAFSTD